MLPDVRIASPCSADWELMVGDDRKRFCQKCSLYVYNLSAMTSVEVESLIANRQGRLCARLYRRADGTILTQDCRGGLRIRIRRVSRVAGAALSAVLGINFAAAQNMPASGDTQLLHIKPAEYSVDVEVVDPSGAMVANADVLLLDDSGRLLAKARTDEQGYAVLMGWPAGPYQIQVVAPGFRTSTTAVDSSKERRVTVHLMMQATMGVIVEVENAVVAPASSVLVEDFIPLASAPQVVANHPTSVPTPPNRPRQRNLLRRFIYGLARTLRL